MSITDNAEQILRERYYEKDSNGNPIENWEGLCTRVANSISSAEDNPSDWFGAFFDMMYELDFLPNSPCLMNAGKPNGQLAACFVLPIGDSMEEIFETIKNGALIHKTGGGTGYSFSGIRGKGSEVKSTQGVASGPVSFMKAFDAATETVKQGGTRRGANMAVLFVYHPDILDFISCKDDSGSLNNFNISVSIPDKFMVDVIKHKHLILKTGEEAIFEKIVDQAHKNGEPGIIFIDRMNESNPTPHIGTFESTNPCWSGDTKIWTVQGEKTFEELVGKEIEVLSQDENGELCFKFMRNIRLTSVDSEIVKVTLEDKNGTQTHQTCTPNHQIYLKNGNKISVEDLKIGDRISSAYYYKANQNYKGITNGTQHIAMHHLIAKHKYGRFPNYPEEHCHHVDGNKHNNVPENIEIWDAKKHDAEHMLGDKNPMYGVWDERNPLFNYDVSGKNNPRYRKDISDVEIVKLRSEGLSYDKIAKKIGCCKYTVQKRFKEASNHKVIFVEEISGTSKVYNGTVDDTHKYFISCGNGDGILSANCGEQPLLPYEVCNLGSINLNTHMNGKEIDWNKLRKTTRTAVRFLDDVIDVSSYPFPEIEKMAKGNRKIGLGVMGFADILITMGVRYGSEDSIEIASEIMEYINIRAEEASLDFAVEKGSYPNFQGESYVRNATRTTIAPTGTISRIANCSSGIEPLFALSYTSDIMDTEQTYFNEALEIKAKEYGWPIRNEDGVLADISEIECLSEFVTAHDIKPEFHIRMQAAFQKHVDNAVSKTINMPNSATKEDVRKAFILAHELGCKGITIYRDGSREQVLNKLKTEMAHETSHGSGYLSAEDNKITQNRSDILEGTTTRKPTGCGNVYVTINTKNGKPYEVISTMGKSGGCSASYIEALCRMISLGLKNGVPLSDMAEQLRGIRCPIPKLGKETILSCSDAISSVFFEHLGGKVPGVQSVADIGYNPQCPECGNQLVHAGGCVECSNKGCGYSRCA